MTSPESFEPRFRKSVRVTLFTEGAIVILIGVLGALNPLVGFPSPEVLIGLGLSLSGINFLIPYIVFKKSINRPRWFLLIGALNAAFGILFLTRILPLLFRPPILFGIWMVFAACARFSMAFENLRAGAGKWWISLTVGGYMLFAAAVMMTTNISRDFSIPSWISVIISGTFMINEGRKLYGEIGG